MALSSKNIFFYYFIRKEIVDKNGNIKIRPGFIEQMSQLIFVKEACFSGISYEAVNNVFCQYMLIIEESLKAYPLFENLTQIIVS